MRTSCFYPQALDWAIVVQYDEVMDKEKETKLPMSELKRIAMLLAKNATKIRQISLLLDIPERTIKYWIYGK